MSSSRAEAARSAPGPRRWAMTTRLTLLYTLCTGLLLAVASALLYIALERGLMGEDRAFLAHKMQVLALILRRQPVDMAGLEQEVRDEAEVSARSQSPYFLRVLAANGRVFAETPGMEALVPLAAFPRSSGAAARQRIWSRGDATLLLDAMTVPAAGADGWKLEAALDIDSDMGLLGRYRRDVIALVSAGLLLAAALGAWITRRGLKPIAAITRTTQRIGAQRLEERLRAQAWPKELAALATEFDRMLARLQESFERLSQFSADLAHELRTPINNLIGETQVILSRERSAETYARALQSALEEYARLARMIDSMLFLAQADQARLPLERTGLEAREELQGVAEFYQALADEQGVELRCEGACRIEADGLLLRRALSNLLSNALKYTSRGGCVTLRAARGHGAAILSVSDTGIGIAPEHLPKLGQRFYRVDAARADGIRGAGLGLAIVRSIMALHDGELAMESRPGAGTTASLVFAKREDDGPVIWRDPAAGPT
jgi:two-component system, OmpR family, heavy metal sensor histidine kinase CusS